MESRTRSVRCGRALTKSQANLQSQQLRLSWVCGKRVIYHVISAEAATGQLVGNERGWMVDSVYAQLCGSQGWYPILNSS